MLSLMLLTLRGTEQGANHSNSSNNNNNISGNHGKVNNKTCAVIAINQTHMCWAVVPAGSLADVDMQCVW